MMDALTRYTPQFRGSGFVPEGMVPRLTNHASIFSSMVSQRVILVK